MWTEFDVNSFDSLFLHTPYNALAGGRMLDGGVYSEFTPELTTSIFPNLRIETGADHCTKYFWYKTEDFSHRD